MSKAPEFRYWKKLKRHPLSAEYPDISGAAAEQMREGIRRFGVLNGRKVTVHEGMVLDGWQMYQACVAENVQPKFQEVPRGMTPEEFVEVVNDNRRHETQELALIRIAHRRQKVAELRAEGKSTHEIAETVGASQATVVRDLGATDSRESVDKVKGKDGKFHPATKPEREPGDDSAEEKAEREAPKNGKPLWTAEKFDQAFGVLVREIDALGKCYKAKETPDAHALRRILKEFRSQFAKWHQQLKKAHRGS
jgi:hypothetical protein